MEAAIIGTGSYLPGSPIDNRTLRARVDNFDEDLAGLGFEDWAKKVTGIHSRHMADESAEQMGAKASRRALDAAGIEPQDVDFIVAASFTPDEDIPNAACSIGDILGNPRAAGFPLNTACAGFLYGLAVAYSFIRVGMYRTVLVVATERLSAVTDFGDPKTAVLFGDGAGAAVMQASERRRVHQPYLAADYSSHIHLENADALPDCRKVFLSMPGGANVLKRAVDGMSGAALKAVSNTPYQMDDIDWIVPHQANGRITQGLITKLAQPAEKFCRTIERFGNTSGSSVPIALDMAMQGNGAGPIKPGDKVLLTAIGGGYSLGAIVLEF